MHQIELNIKKSNVSKSYKIKSPKALNFGFLFMYCNPYLYNSGTMLGGISPYNALTRF